MGNQEGEGYTAEQFWRLALAAGKGSHNTAVGDKRETHVVRRSSLAHWYDGIKTYLFFLTMRLGN